ncbi:TPA: hypothetical protein MIO58_26890 [Klebsiella pneumoniae subsp. pneumoniae]|nr:hypothetical protein [Klebsiella pneumoniae subsp. pneumoniae]
MSLITTAWCFNVKCIVGGILWGKSFSMNGVINKNIPRSLLFTFQVFARDRLMINFYTGEKIGHNAYLPCL